MKKDVTLDVSKGAKASPLSRKSVMDFVQKYTMVLVLVLVAAFFTWQTKGKILLPQNINNLFAQRYAATVRMMIPSYEQEGMLWRMLMEETQKLGLLEGDPCYYCAVFHDKEYREAQVDVEVQRTVKGSYPDTEHVRFRTLSEVTAASVTFKGSYEQMGEVNAAVAAWIADNGYAFDGPLFNIYHVSPHETSNPDEFVTEVCCPVRKA